MRHLGRPRSGCGAGAARGVRAGCRRGPPRGPDGRRAPADRHGLSHTRVMAGSRYRVGVLGATGAVGSTILGVLAERDFPASEVVPFASERSAGHAIEWGEEQLEVR